MRENIVQNSSPWPKRTKVAFLLLCFLTSMGLWLYSAGLYYRPLQSPAFSVTARSLIFQMCSEQGAIHTILMWGFPTRASLGFSRATNLGRGGYHHGLGIDLGGFVLRLLPHEFNGGDYTVPPHAALVVPYWATMTAAGLLLLWVSGLYSRLRPYLRFSSCSIALMATLSVAFMVANVYPWTTRHGGVLRDYGFPAVYLRRAIQDNETLTSFMGYDLGWRQSQLVENFLLAVLVVVAVGLIVELARHRFALKDRSTNGIKCK